MVRGHGGIMSSWMADFRFLVAFGGACMFGAGAVALFVWLIGKLDEHEEKTRK